MARRRRRSWVIRLGARTLTDESLTEQCDRTFTRWGIYGFSVLEVPGGDCDLLARLVPIVAVRPRLFEAAGDELIEAGFPLLPTAAHPHWTVVLSAPTVRQFSAVRSLFHRTCTTRRETTVSPRLLAPAPRRERADSANRSGHHDCPPDRLALVKEYVRSPAERPGKQGKQYSHPLPFARRCQLWPAYV